MTVLPSTTESLASLKPMPIPDGPVDIEFTDDSVTLGWVDGEKNAGSAAITRDEFDRYVREGKIRVEPQHG